MSAYALDRLISGGAYQFDRLVDTIGTPKITSLGTVRDGSTLTIIGTSFSGSGNTVFIVQGSKTLQIAVGTENTTSITTVALDTSGIYITQPISIYILNNSLVASNSVVATILSAVGESAYPVALSFLGDPTTRGSSSPDMTFGDEVRFKNVVGDTIAGLVMNPQGDVVVTAAVTANDYAIQDGTLLGNYATMTWANPVSTGTVPNVVGLSQLAATVLIVAAGFIVAVVSPVQSATAAFGNVASQFPDATAPLVLGGTVEIATSLGATGVLVPLLIGLTEFQAQTARSSAGLVGSDLRYIDGVNSGNVLNQSVSQGTLVNTGDAVDIVVSSNLVPNVQGLLLQTAEAILLAANLTVNDSDTRRAYDAVADVDVIIVQSPSPDTIIVPGAEVFLTESLGPAPTRPGPTPLRKRICNVC